MIHIITPCTRVENLPQLAASIPTQCAWTIVLDACVGSDPDWSGINAVVLRSPYTGDSGNPNRNFALDHVKLDDLDWVYILDDDNIIHPNWYAGVKDIQDPRLTMVSWGQLWKSGDVRLTPTARPAVGNVDTASYMIRGSVMKTLRYPMSYVADGIVAEKAFDPERYLCIPEYLAYYNYLR